MDILKFIASFISLFIFFAHADKIRVGADAWADVTEHDGSGIYFKVLKEIYGAENIEINIESYHRGLKSFNDQKLDILVGIFREDVKHAILPKWYIDTDDPIIVFYRAEDEKTAHINNLSNLTNSWVRGFHFERFISETPNPYLVNSAQEGFTLLANKRIDTFIDYLSNVPLSLARKFKHFELLPSRHLYVAFQKNQYGQKLANTYDKKMSELRSSGKLKTLYAGLYEKSELDSFQENKEKMIILTDEVNLLRGQKSQIQKVNQTLSNNINLLFDQLNEYDFEFKMVHDYSNIEQSANQDNLCYCDMLKTEEREKHFQFSDPFAIYLGLQLYSKTPLPTNTNNQVNLRQLFVDNPEHKIGLVLGRSFGEKIDQQLADLKRKQVIEIPAKLNSILAIFNHDRFDYLIEYPQYVNLHWPNISNQKLYSYAIEGGKPYSVGYMMCTKTKTNDIFITRFNQSIENLGRSGTLFNVLSSEINQDKRAEFKRYFREIFSYEEPYH